MQEFGTVIDPNKDQMLNYEELVVSDPSSLYYASPAYLEMLKDVVGGRIVLFYFKEGGKWLSCLPAMFRGGKYGDVINSLPFFGSNPGIVCHPILEGDHKRDVKRRLLDIFWNLTATFFSATLIERPFEEDQDIYNEAGSVFVDDRIGMMTKLNVPNILQSIHQKTRNMIRKGAKSGLSIVTDIPVEEAVDIVQEIHTENMTSIGAPVKPQSFFDWLKTDPPGLSISFAVKEGDIASGLVLLRHNKTVEYFTPVVRKDFRQYAPLNFLIYDEMMNMGHQGVDFWNWGGTTLPQMEGVYRFKKRFGADEQYYRYHTRVSADVLKRVTSTELMREYPFYFVVPFNKLQGGDFYGED